MVKTHGIPFWLVNSPPILESILVLDWDVHWGYDLDFDPWPWENHGTRPLAWRLWEIP